MADGEIVGLRVADLAQLEALLRANHLPADDCSEQASIFCAMYHAGELIAAGGLEPAGECALLRSVVVRADHRGKGLARAITEHLLRRAEAGGRVAVYLLTETAAGYFTRLGFTAIARSKVPLPITRTRQFSSLCPDSASCLCLPLPRGWTLPG
jgi:N-acetylglutamate synthase-like GNAT family acetyltransferase